MVQRNTPRTCPKHLGKDGAAIYRRTQRERPGVSPELLEALAEQWETYQSVGRELAAYTALSHSLLLDGKSHPLFAVQQKAFDTYMRIWKVIYKTGATDNDSTDEIEPNNLTD